MEEFSTTPIIDNGNKYNWGQTSEDYALYRDIYPEALFNLLHALNIGTKNQIVIDLGTGTGSVPRFLAKFGGKFIGIDISHEQINYANKLSNQLDYDLEWRVAPAEQTGLPDSIADVIMACQCFIYFDKSKAIPEILRLLRPQGRFAKISMIWLPYEDELAGKTEELILKYNPNWTGAHHNRMPLTVSDWSKEHFIPVTLHTFDYQIPFTRDTLRGRIRACRGMGASSIPVASKKAFDQEFKEYLLNNAPEQFTVLHQIWIEIYKAK